MAVTFSPLKLTRIRVNRNMQRRTKHSWMWYLDIPFSRIFLQFVSLIIIYLGIVGDMQLIMYPSLHSGGVEEHAVATYKNQKQYYSLKD